MLGLFMADFSFGKDMKKFLIIIFCVVSFILMWISWGLKGALAFFITIPFIVASVFAFVFAFVRWREFVDKHMKG